MNLDTYQSPGELYLARGAEVNLHRPTFTGDIYHSVPIPGVGESELALVLAHPCSFRGGEGRLAERVLVAQVESFRKEGADMWRRGLLDYMPLPDLDGNGWWVGNLAASGRALAVDLHPKDRIACLSEFGINMLQQRLTCHLTRAEIPTRLFHEAFSNTMEEADLLEEWTDITVASGMELTAAAAAFEVFIVSGDPSYQRMLIDPQQRTAVRRACRQAATRLASISPLA